MSFHEIESGLDEGMVELAQIIHGCLVPQTTYHGIMNDSDPPLRIYKMPLLPGIAWSETLSHQVDLYLHERTRHVNFVRGIARYKNFILPLISQDCMKQRKILTYVLFCFSTSRRKGTLLDAGPRLNLPNYRYVTSTTRLPSPANQQFSRPLHLYQYQAQRFPSSKTSYPDSSPPNTLGLDTRRSFRNKYPSHIEKIDGDGDGDGSSCQEDIRAVADAAAKIGAVLRYALDPTADGSSSNVLTTSEYMSTMLKACISSQLVFFNKNINNRQDGYYYQPINIQFYTLTVMMLN